MASKYSVTLAADDGYSAAFRGFAEAAEEMQESMRGHQAELREHLSERDEDARPDARRDFDC